MPSVSEKQHRAMEAAAHGNSNLGIPEKVGKEFVAKDAETPSSENENELSIVRKMISGDLSGPQKYANVTLFDMRITGTGTSYREALDEIVYRPPENFLTEDFVQRCNGLPVIFEHPEGKSLDTKEYRERAIGTIVFPYIKADEVWGIAKIYDQDAADLMQSSHLSTSPAVVFKKTDGNRKIEFADGSHLLIEGVPSLLDHLAICREGVWDKGNGPKGISQGDEAMPETDKEVIKEGFKENSEGKKDGSEEMPAWADAFMKKVDSRFDALEKGRVDHSIDGRKDEDKEGKKEGGKEKKSEEEAKKEIEKAEKEGDKERSDKARKDAEKKDAEGETETKRQEKDDARHDSIVKENSDLKKRLQAVESTITNFTRELSGEDKNALASAQARADSLAQCFGETVTSPLSGETPISYRKRLAEKFQKHSSDRVKVIKLDNLDIHSFPVIEDQIYADAIAISNSPSLLPKGRLIEHKTKDESGRTITSYTGDIAVFLEPFAMKPRAFRLNTDRRNG